jgi:hypothetical protein
VEDLAPHSDLDVVAISFHNFDVGHVEHMHAAAGLRQDARGRGRCGYSLQLQLLQSG